MLPIVIHNQLKHIIRQFSGEPKNAVICEGGKSARRREDADCGAIETPSADQWAQIFRLDQVKDYSDWANAPHAKKSRRSGIADFGEKLQGARKDGWRTMVSEDVRQITLARNFPEPDYAQAIRHGVPVEFLAVVKAIRDSIPKKPHQAWLLDPWADTVVGLHEFVRTLVTSGCELTPALLERCIDELHSPAIRERVRLYNALGCPTFTCAKGWRVSSGVTTGFGCVRFDVPTLVTFAVCDSHLQTDIHSAKQGNEGYDEVVQLIRRKILSGGGKPATVKTRAIKFGIYRDPQTRDCLIGAKTANRIARVKSGFSSPELAHQYLNDNRDELERLWQELKTPPACRRSSNEPRQGPSRRKADVTPDQFQNAFLFRGVQFGNWVEEKRRQADLNDAFDALMDLSEVLGIPSRALSLDSSLGLAFGARGGGGFISSKAHYENKEVVINLTKKSGPGSLAHEWFHALDNYFARLDQTGATKPQQLNRCATSWDHPPVNMRPEVWEAFRRIRVVLRSGPFAKRSAALDAARTKPYYSTMAEKAARAFERYVVRKLETKHIRNDYLVNLIKDSSPALPTDEEMESGIEQAYDNLFGALSCLPARGGTSDTIRLC